MNWMARQGDILLMPVGQIPAKAEAIECEGERVILAEGESTGHAHAIVLDRESDVTLYTVADEVDRWLRVQSRPVALRHEEHSTVILPPGDYVVRRQREYSPEALRMVAD